MSRGDKQRGAREPATSADESAPAESVGKPSRSLGRVVVADDEPHLSFLVRVILEKVGYQVVEALNGEVALQLVAEAPTQLVVTDRMMPVMNGPTLVARLRADHRTASIPIVMLSSNPDNSAPVDAFLNKPFAPDELVRLAERLINATDKGITS